MKVAARSLGVQLQLVEARGPDDFESAFAAMARERVGALLHFSDGMGLLHRARIVELAAKHRLPVMYGLREFVDAGGLVVYGPSMRDSFRRAATYVDKILKGAKPADLPIEQPTKFELVINLKTAKALGLTIPQSVPGASGSGDRVMDRRAFIGTLTGSLLAAPLAAEAQQPVRVARIGVLAPGDPPSLSDSPRLEAFRRELRERGWVEGQNIAIEWRFAEGKNRSTARPRG